MARKFLLMLSLLFLPNITWALGGCVYMNGYWGNWNNLSVYIRMNGYVDNFVLYADSEHPSNFFFRVRINNFQLPSKDSKRNHLKNNRWYEYSGTAEYYVTDEYPTITSIFNTMTGKSRSLPWFVWANELNPRHFQVFGTTHVKRTANAKIIIAPYKNKPEVYNIFFDNVGIALNLNYNGY